MGMGDLARLGRTALEVPRIAFGAAALSFGGGTGSVFGGAFKYLSDTECTNTLNAAWDAGIRFFDTAPWYGRGLSEHRVGSSLAP